MLFIRNLSFPNYKMEIMVMHRCRIFKGIIERNVLQRIKWHYAWLTVSIQILITSIFVAYRSFHYQSYFIRMRCSLEVEQVTKVDLVELCLG